MDNIESLIFEILEHIRYSAINILGVNRAHIYGIKIKSYIGCGSYGYVYEIALLESTRRDEQRCAMKVQKTSPAALNEINVNLRLLGVEGVCRFYGFIVTRKNTYIFMELLENCIMLDDYINSGTMNIEDAKRIAIALTKYTAHIHARKITHNDLYSNSNILYDESCKDIVIIDFGNAKYDVYTDTCQDIRKLTDIIVDIFKATGYDLPIIDELLNTNFSEYYVPMSADEILDALYEI